MMAIMQEDQTVSFQPMYVDGPLPWYERLFALYLLAVLLIYLFRVVRLAINLYKLRKEREQFLAAPVANALLTDCYARVRSFKEISVLTLLISSLCFTWYTADSFSSVITAKAADFAFVLREVANALGSLMAGLVLSIVLYSTAMLSGAMLSRRNSASSALDRD